jgi:hypothetical protein
MQHEEGKNLTDLFMLVCFNIFSAKILFAKWLEYKMEALE